MYGITLIAQEAAMATTQLARSHGYEGCASPEMEYNKEHSRLRMNWVVAIDELGRPHLRACWTIAPQRRE